MASMYQLTSNRIKNSLRYYRSILVISIQVDHQVHRPFEVSSRLQFFGGGPMLKSVMFRYLRRISISFLPKASFIQFQSRSLYADRVNGALIHTDSESPVCPNQNLQCLPSNHPRNPEAKPVWRNGTLHIV